MKTTILALTVAALAGTATADVSVGIDPSGAAWLGYMNVFELPANGGGFVFGSSWGVADLVANFDDGANTLTMSPNTIGDPDPFWYQGGGGPGAAGNKIMEANLYQQVDGGLAGQTVNFSGNVLSYSFTDAHNVRVFIRDFAADFSSSVEVYADIDASGAFSISLATIDDASRHVQWGVQVSGVNVWFTDTAAFGNVVFGTVPTPGSLALLGLGGLAASRRRR
jgi:MYXO-CTERM domain-containing protein